MGEINTRNITEQSKDQKITEDISGKALTYAEEGPASSDYRLDYEMEKRLLYAIRTGDIETVQSFTDALFQRDMRLIHHTHLHQYKASLICIVTLATRAAIDGGMGYQDAFNLSDSYISSVEYVNDEATVMNMIRSCLVEFTRRVRDSTAANQRRTEEYLRWIKDHIYEPITVKTMSESLHISSSQLSRIFRQELGFTPAAFIRRCKLEESRQLLLYSSRSIEEIAVLLNYASASHFIQAFSKQYHTTPAKYRRHGGDINQDD